MTTENKEDLTKVFNQLDSILAASDLSNVTEESSGFAELPDGYYLSEVDSAKLTVSKSSGKPMVAFQLSIVEDGKTADILETGDIIIDMLPKTKGRKIFVYYVLKDDSAVKRFASDMLKFEGNPGEPLLQKEYFTTSATLVDALDILVGSRIYVHVSTTERDDGTKSKWQNFISWKRATALELCK